MSTLLTAQTALLDLLQQYPAATFDASNSSINKWDVLMSQGRDYSAVIEMDEATQEGDELNGYREQGMYQETHRLALWIAWKRGQGDGGDAAQKAACLALTEGIKDFMRPYLTLNGAASVIEARITETSEPQYLAPRSVTAASTHVAHRVRWRVQCESEFPIGGE